MVLVTGITVVSRFVANVVKIAASVEWRVTLGEISDSVVVKIVVCPEVVLENP